MMQDDNVDLVRDVRTVERGTAVGNVLVQD